MLSSLDIGASALKAQRLRLDTISQNIASANVVEDADGKNNPYQRRFVVMKSGRAESPDGRSLPGVHVSSIEKDTAVRFVRDEGNPLAQNGYVKYPNVDLTTEFVNALEASRAYDANITMMETTKSLFNSTLRLLA